MRLGNFLEPFVVQEYERITSNKTRRHDATMHHPYHPELFGHVDRIATGGHQSGNNSTVVSSGDIVLECKTCSAFRAKEWGPAWSDQVPAEYLAQCLWYLGLANCEEAHLAVLLGNTDFRVYRIKRDRDIERHMFELAHSFWVEHVLTRRPPLAKTRAQAQSLHPTPDDGRAHQAGDQTLNAIKRKAQLEIELLEIQAEIERLNDCVAVSMGGAERLTWQGKTLATWRLSKGVARLDVERLRRERPDITESYTVHSPATRRLQINTKALKQCTTQE
jgi:predicted phage-related endonuclease